MPFKNPRSAAGRFWLGQFNTHYTEWLASGQSQKEPLFAAARDLRTLLEQSPDDAPTVQSIALSATFTAALSAGPEAVSELGSVGRHADLLQVAQTTERGGARVLLNLYLAEAELSLRNQHQGLDLLVEAENLLGETAPSPRIASYLAGYASYLRGALSELGLAMPQAVAAYTKAAHLVDPIVLAAGLLADSACALLELAFGTDQLPDETQSNQFLMIGVNQIRRIASLNALGRIRAKVMDPQRPNAGRLPMEVWRVVRRTGVPGEAGPLDVFPLVVSLPTKDAVECAALLIEKVGAARRDGADWKAVLNAALLPRITSKSRAKEKAAVSQALSQVGNPLIEAFVRSRVLMATNSSAQSKAVLVQEFLTSLRQLANAPNTPLEQLRVRALFDEPIAICVELARRDFASDPTEIRRARFAALLEALRGAKLSDVAVIPDDAPAPGTPEAGLLPAHDRLQRIAHALRRHPEAVAIVLQRQRRGWLFICVTGNLTNPLCTIDAGSRCRAAMRRLSETVSSELERLSDNIDALSSRAVADAGKAAFDALPKTVQTLIARHRTLLIAPDYRADDDTPFELIHDGSRFLGESRVVARFISLRSLTSAVEHLARRPRFRRAVVAAAPRVEGWEDLENSEREVERVRAILLKAGWDAPAIKEERLSAKLLLDGLELISLMHLSTHGEVALDEAIILPGGARFTSEHVLQKRFARLPVAYLNTCSVGKTRYLGGGISRGVAHTLVDAGAPAAIANLLQIEDITAANIALEFYRQARQHPVGEALRRARSKAHRQGADPVLWGATVLSGDPWVTLEPKANTSSVSQQLLDAYFSLRTDDESREEKRTAAVVSLLTDPGDVRLKAAVELLRWAAGVTELSTAENRGVWDRVVRLADEVNHLPAMALTRFARINYLPSDMQPLERLRLIDDALYYLRAMEAEDENWNQLVHRAYWERTKWDPDGARLTVRTPGEDVPHELPS